MMKKIFIPIAALALFTLVACGNGESSAASSSVGPTYSKVEMLSITISNKEALKAEWHVGEADRAIEIESNPKINVSAAIAAGDLVITSSDEAVVKVIGRNIHAVGAGTATVTVTYGDKSDTVELSPAAMLGEPGYVVGKGLADVMAVKDLVTDGDNARSKLAYAVKVKVEVIGSKSDGSKTADKYGNMWVKAEDGSGDLVQVYGSSASISALSYDLALGAYKFPGAKDYLDNPLTAAIKVGDVLDVLAIRADYKGAPEISMVIRAINGAVLANAEQTTDEVLETELTDQVKQQVFAVTGKITALGSAADGSKPADKYGNMYIKSEGAKGNALQVYGTTATASALAINEGEVKYTSPKDYLENEGTKNLKVGDLVTIVGVRCDYQEKIEIQGIVSLAGEPDPEGGESTDFTATASYDFSGMPGPAQGENSKHVDGTSLKEYMAAHVTGTDIVSAAEVENGMEGVVYEAKIDESPAINGLKFGSSKKNGKVTFTLSEGMKYIKFSGKTWSEKEFATIDVNGKTVTMNEASVSAVADFTITLDEAATSLVVSVTKRAVFTAIVFGK